MQMICRARITYVAIMLSMLASVGCGRVLEKDVYGTYELKHSFGTERLVLKPSGNYVQDVTVDSVSVHHEGTWRYEAGTTLSAPSILLKDPVDVQGDFGGLDPEWMKPFAGYMALGVGRTALGRIVLGSDEEKQLRKIK